MNPPFKDLQTWKAYLRKVAQNMAAEDRIMDAGRYFVQCQEWVKHSGRFYLTDGGMYELLMTLMKNAKNSRQAKQVEYLLDEFFPTNMHPSWHGRYRPLANELMAMRIRCEK